MRKFSIPFWCLILCLSLQPLAAQEVIDQIPNVERLELLLTRAEIAKNRNRWFKAIDYLDEILQLDPLFQKAIELKLAILEERQDYGKAIVLYKRLIKEQIKDLKEKGKIQPDDILLGNLFALARSYYSLYTSGRVPPERKKVYFNLALKWFKTIRHHQFALAYANYFIAHLYYLDSNFLKAIPYFERADKQMDFKSAGEIKLLNRFFLAASLTAVGRVDEALFHMMYIYRNIEKNPDIKGSLLGYLNSLSKPRVSAALGYSKVYDSNATSLVEGERLDTGTRSAGLADEFRFNITYSGYTLRKLSFLFGLTGSMLAQNREEFDEFSYRTYAPYLSLKYTKFNKEWANLTYSYSKVQTRQRILDGDDTKFTTFSDIHSVSLGYTWINRFGNFTLKVPFSHTEFREPGLEPTQITLLSLTEDFHPYSWLFDFTFEVQAGEENTHIDSTRAYNFNSYLTNNSQLGPVLFRQNAYLEFSPLRAGDGHNLSYGASGSFFYTLPFLGRPTFNLDYTYSRDHFKLGGALDIVTKHVIKLGFDKYF